MCLSRESAREVPKLRRILAQTVRRKAAERQGEVKRKSNIITTASGAYKVTFKAKRKTKKKPRKQSSARVSSLAAKWLKYALEPPLDGPLIVPSPVMATLCASVLSQDETKGQR
jgi:hypothetical protein